MTNRASIQGWRLLGWACLALLAACAQAPQAQRSEDDPLPYAEAVQAMASSLAAQLQAQRGVLGRVQLGRLQSLIGETTIAVDPFLDAQNGYATRFGQRLQDDLAARIREAAPSTKFAPLSTEALRGAQYVMSGSIGFEPRGSAGRNYRAQVGLLDAKTGAVVAHASAWLAERNLEMTPLPIYQDSPVFITDRYMQGLVETSRTPAGQPAERTYFSQLSTQALLSEAQAAFNAEDFRGALALYQRAETRPDGKSLRTYSGLYVTQLKLGNAAEAEKAFADLIATAFAANNLSIRFLFTVNSTDFLADPKLTQQYRIWTRQLAQYVARTRSCVDVQGHSSRTGNEAYNDQLSLQRAEALRRLLQQESAGAMQLTKATGRGFHDNLVGSGTDDARDAIDRRVDFKIVPCGQVR